MDKMTNAHERRAIDRQVSSTFHVARSRIAGIKNAQRVKAQIEADKEKYKETRHTNFVLPDNDDPLFWAVRKRITGEGNIAMYKKSLSQKNAESAMRELHFDIIKPLSTNGFITIQTQEDEEIFVLKIWESDANSFFIQCICRAN